MGETDTETEPAAEDTPPAPAPTGAEMVAAWKARDRGAELKALAADPAAVAAMRRRLVSLGITPAANPFDGSQTAQAPAAPRGAPKETPGSDWRKWLPKGFKS